MYFSANAKFCLVVASLSIFHSIFPRSYTLIMNPPIKYCSNNIYFGSQFYYINSYFGFFFFSLALFIQLLNYHSYNLKLIERKNKFIFTYLSLTQFFGYQSLISIHSWWCVSYLWSVYQTPFDTSMSTDTLSVSLF